MQVFVIRHTKVNISSSVCYGQTDVDLAETFWEEAKELHKKVNHEFDAVYSSPLNRCQELAKTFTKEIIFDERLKEFNFGDWEMKFWNKIPSEQIRPWYADFVQTQTPNGESMEEMFLRVSDFMNELRTKEHDRILIVTHGGVIRLIWCYLLQIPLQNTFKIPVNYGEIFQFKLGENKVEDFILRK
ncbi:phosphoglycerate mutase [Empedobacter brevis NBRC 14943 = ATCC 43319]|uniref:Alpha-ribazole phosphatase n=1 Tax=Empedobacter brevis NBRC 14943 = ATCC 43319 TaxID=1218108 RepID=A0A511NLS6_9FLAO|nr:alpha-ribazole phosphatase [Empedobacter brevis]GEM53749.1 phosphoglycerate mutase [Empedobacter brevis NBRC 14943 = ATCC 43319]